MMNFTPKTLHFWLNDYAKNELVKVVNVLESGEFNVEQYISKSSLTEHRGFNTSFLAKSLRRLVLKFEYRQINYTELCQYRIYFNRPNDAMSVNTDLVARAILQRVYDKTSEDKPDNAYKAYRRDLLTVRMVSKSAMRY